MPKIIIPPEVDADLRKVAPPYLRRTTARVLWAVEQTLKSNPARQPAERPAKARRAKGEAA